MFSITTKAMAVWERWHEMESNQNLLNSWRALWIVKDMLRQLMAAATNQQQFANAELFALFSELNRTYGTLQHSFRTYWTSLELQENKNVPVNSKKALQMHVKLQLRCQLLNYTDPKVRWSSPAVQDLNKYVQKAWETNSVLLNTIPTIENSEEFVQTINEKMLQYLILISRLQNPKSSETDSRQKAQDKLDAYKKHAEETRNRFKVCLVKEIKSRNIRIANDAANISTELAREKKNNQNEVYGHMPNTRLTKRP